MFGLISQLHYRTNFCYYKNQILSITFNIIIWVYIFNVSTNNIRQILCVSSFSASSLLDI